MAPPNLATRNHRLPPMLNSAKPTSIPSYSKASRGLFVLPRVIRIFTDYEISPSPWLREFPDRYPIRAGRNLPDKEFRYLRTVIVTAGVHPGLGLELKTALRRLITPPLNLRTLARGQPLYLTFRFEQGPTFLLNSRLGSFAAPPFA